MGLFEKIKSSVEMWKIEKYTKRRPVNVPDFEQKGTSWVNKHIFTYYYQTESFIVNIIRMASIFIINQEQRQGTHLKERLHYYVQGVKE